MKRILVFISCLIWAGMGQADLLLSANGQSYDLHHNSKCEKLGSLNPQDICDCCLLQKAILGNESSMDAVNSCLEAGHCKREQVNQGTPVEALQKAEHRLDPMKISRLESWPNAPTIPADGLLTTDTAIDIVQMLMKNHLLSLPSTLYVSHENYKCLDAKALGDNTKGYYSGQLFAVRFNRRCLKGEADTDNWQPLYVLKETKKGEPEIKNLYRISHSNLGQEKVPTMNLVYRPEAYQRQAMARVSFDDFNFTIEHEGKLRYYSLLQTASGKSLNSNLKSFGKAISGQSPAQILKSPEYAKAARMFYRIGFAVSKLHQKYGRTDFTGEHLIAQTYTHGDFHINNLFYDPVTEDVTLIDNENFAISLQKPTSGVNDIVDLYLLHTVNTIGRIFTSQFDSNREMGIDDVTWHRLWQELLWGYMQAFEPVNHEQRQQIFKQLHHDFIYGISSSSFFDSITNITDVRKIKRVGPSFRRTQIKHQELENTFDALYFRLQ